MIHNHLTDIPHKGSLCQIYPAQEARELSEYNVLAQDLQIFILPKCYNVMEHCIPLHWKQKYSSSFQELLRSVTTYFDAE